MPSIDLPISSIQLLWYDNTVFYRHEETEDWQPICRWIGGNEEEEF
jgi:hypothetical protein